MARGGKDRKSDIHTRSRAMASSNEAEFPTTIGPDAVFKGELRFEKGVKQLGKFEGQIETKGHLVVAKGAELKGEVSAGNVDVQGDVKGNLTVSGKVSLAASAKLEGDLQTARLEVAEGAIFIGRCRVGTNGSPSADHSKTESAPAKERGPVPAAVGAKK